MKKDFSDGICNNCGNTGLAGEKCLVCGDVISKIDEGLFDPIVHGDEIYPLETLEKEEKEEKEDDEII